MKVLTIAAMNLKRLTRDRIALFFVFVFPMILILLIGVSFGGDFTPRLGVVFRGGGGFGDELVRSITAQPGLDVQRFDNKSSLVDGVERGMVDAAVVVPAAYDDALRSGRQAQIAFVAHPGDLSTALRTSVDSVVAGQAARVRAARLGASYGGVTFQEALTRAGTVATTLPGVDVAVTSAGGGADQASFGRFDLGAASQLVLFVFLNSVAGSVALIQSRQLGMLRRMLSTPLSARTVLLGEAAGRFGIALVQGAFIVFASALLFGVRWGDPPAAAALVVAFSLVATGAAVLFGSILSNEHQAAALTPLGLALAALGGCMVPLEIFSPTMKKIAHLTPHAWAIEGFTALIRRHASLAAVMPQLGVLVAFAVVLLAAASWRLRRAIVG